MLCCSLEKTAANNMCLPGNCLYVRHKRIVDENIFSDESMGTNNDVHSHKSLYAINI